MNSEIEPYAIFVRNLTCALGQTCFVANTNLNITNLISFDAAVSRVGSENEGWCIVVKRLNPAVPSMFSSIKDKLVFLKASCNVDTELVTSASALFDRVFGEVLLKARPGIADFVIKAVNALYDQLFEGNFPGPKTLARFLHFCLTSVSQDLSTKKPTVSMSECSMIAKMDYF